MLRKRNRKHNKWKKLTYSSSFIPLSSMVALLALSLSLVNPSTSSNSIISSIANGLTNTVDIVTNEVYADNNISLLAEDNIPSASFSYSGSLDLSNTGAITGDKTNTVITMTNNITVEARLINNYNLQISSTSTTLDGPTTINPTTEVSNANNLANDTWGYSWNNSNYKGITTTPVTIANDSIDSNGTVYYTKPLTFAAKFSKEAIAGHYTTTVTLSLAAAPKTLVTYTLSYNANDGNNGNSTTNLPTTQTISNYNTSHTFTIPNTTSTIPTRSGYEFAGYATTSNGSVAYQPGNTITLPTTSSTNTSSTVTQVLYAVWKQLYSYTLTYDANTGTGAPSSQSCSSTNTSCSITITSTTPTKSGLVFQGWNTKADGTGTNYNSNASITLTTNTTLYATYGPSVTGFGGIKKMQDMTTSICNGITNGTTGQLYDTRDNSTYTVRKMPDGKCWMTENLRIMNKNISSSDSNLAENASFTIPASSTSSFNNDTASNAYLGADAKGKSTGYYTWCAATAGTCSSAPNADDIAPSSICPKGWRLPTGGRNYTNGSTSEFYNLIMNGILKDNSNISSWKSTVTSQHYFTDSNAVNIIKGSPYNFAFTGYMYNRAYNTPASVPDGRWWSSTANSSTYAYYLYIYGNNSSVYPGTINDSRHLGCAVRCVAQ